MTLNPAHENATAAGFANQDDDCGNAADQDGWHFIAPSNENFINLTLTFDTGVIVLNQPAQFGPPDASHAFVSTPVGAVLLSGTGTTDGATPQGTFNLSHTCPGTPPTSQPPTTEPPSTEPPSTEPPTSAPPEVDDGELPKTGGGSLPILFGLGVVLLTTGAATVIAVARRSSSTTE